MTHKDNKIIIEVPHRISGFFEIVDKINNNDIEDPLKIGSRGAGFCLSIKGRTEIISKFLEKGKNSEVKIYINGERLDKNAETTYYIVKYLKKDIKKPLKIKIIHNFELPVGCGFGTSGCGALGTVFGLNSLLNLKLSDRKKIKIAHIAEVTKRTGLGTVCGQIGGGLGILKEPGYPCTYERITIPQDLKIICTSFGMIHTKSVLSDPILNLKIKEAGREALKNLLMRPSIETFIKVSRNFVNKSELIDILNLTEVKELLRDLDKLKIIGCSMNQLGRSVYILCKNNQESNILNLLESYKPDIQVFKTSIYEQKPIDIK